MTHIWYVGHVQLILRQSGTCLSKKEGYNSWRESLLCCISHFVGILIYYVTLLRSLYSSFLDRGVHFLHPFWALCVQHSQQNNCMFKYPKFGRSKYRSQSSCVTMIRQTSAAFPCVSSWYTSFDWVALIKSKFSENSKTCIHLLFAQIYQSFHLLCVRVDFWPLICFKVSL